jgi:hypothetical protein
MAIQSKSKGKSSGARIITYIKVSISSVYITPIYDKSSQSDLCDQELEKIFRLIP